MTAKGRVDAKPRCMIIAGPDGTGKTTFAREFLPGETDIVQFVNAGLIAGGRSPACTARRST
jgi:predicted ABC-type ATPase